MTIDFDFNTKKIRNGFIVVVEDHLLSSDRAVLPLYCEDSEQVIRNFVLKLVPPDEAKVILDRAFPHQGARKR